MGDRENSQVRELPLAATTEIERVSFPGAAARQEAVKQADRENS